MEGRLQKIVSLVRSVIKILFANESDWLAMFLRLSF